LLPVSFDDALAAQKEARDQYPKWFSERDERGLIRKSYRLDADGYYLRWHSAEQNQF
jgi:hypothetical protein